MAKFKVSFTKKSGAKAAAAPHASGPVVDFQLLDNQNDSVTIQGASAAGNPIDISTVATITVKSDNESVLTVSTPSGMTYVEKAVGSTGSANVTVTATWNDGSVGPFSISYPVTVTAGPAGGLVVTHGTPIAN